MAAFATVMMDGLVPAVPSLPSASHPQIAPGMERPLTKTALMAVFANVKTKALLMLGLEKIAPFLLLASRQRTAQATAQQLTWTRPTTVNASATPASQERIVISHLHVALDVTAAVTAPPKISTKPMGVIAHVTANTQARIVPSPHLVMPRSTAVDMA
jgi:hypothetical protein